MGSDHERQSHPSRTGTVGVVLALTVGSATAQQTTGTPGSPSATSTVDGRYIPPPPAPFGGTIPLDAKDSKPYWPPTVVPPKAAPNVLLVMTDDQGYGVPSTFGGVIPTPCLDRIASRTALHAVSPLVLARERRCSRAVTTTPWASA